ncbi:MAG: DUF4340 domain-containing protein [Candidatus Nanoarchaeia archaeon]
MKGKQIFLAIVITVALLALVFAMLKREEKVASANESSIGKELLKDLPVNDVQKIKIKGPKSGEVIITKGDEGWSVSSLFNYPADFAKVKEFITEIAELKNIQNIEVGKSNLSRLNLEINESSDSGTTVEFLGNNDKQIATLIVGKEHKKKTTGEEEAYGGMEYPDGRYILVQGKNDVHVVDKTLNKIENSSKDWLNKDFISAIDFKIASLEQEGQTKWTVYREKKEDPMKPDIPVPDEHEIDKDKMSSIANCLYTIRFANIADPNLPPSETGLDNPSIFRAETFNGKKYEISIGKQKDNARYVKVAVSYSTPKEEVPDEQAQSSSDDPKAKEEKEKKEKERAEALKKAEEEAKSEQEKYGKWIYLIAEASLKAMLSSEKELFKKIEKKEDNKKEQNVEPPPPPIPSPEDENSEEDMPEEIPLPSQD